MKIPFLRALLLFIVVISVESDSLAFTSKRKTDALSSGGDSSESSGLTLGQILKGNLLGLSSESPETVQQALERAKTYSKIRKGRASKAEQEEFLKACENASTRHAFCEFYDGEESLRIGFRSKRVRESKYVNPQVLQKIKKAFAAGDLEVLKTASDRELRKALSQLDKFEKLEKAAVALTASKDCALAPLSFLMAGKAEEFLPDLEVRKKAIAIYELASNCEHPEYSPKANYRVSLLKIWSEDFVGALPHLDKLTTESGDTQYRSRALYWKMFCASKIGVAEKGTVAREILLKDAPFTLHGLLVNRESPARFKPYLSRMDSGAQFRSSSFEKLNGPIMAVESLLENKEDYLARELMGKIATTVTGNPKKFEVEPELQLYLASLLNRLSDYLTKFKVLTLLFKNHPESISRASLELYFPRKGFTDPHFVAVKLNGYLVLSLVRQESAFNERATSPAGARGLMQLMPRTARRIERIRTQDLYDPAVNVRIGSKFFERLVERYEGDVELALAAYNAGPLKVDAWLKRYPIENRALFLDLIPYRETRDYVASIVRNFFWYSILYTQDNPSWVAELPESNLDKTFPFGKTAPGFRLFQ